MELSGINPLENLSAELPQSSAPKPKSDFAAVFNQSIEDLNAVQHQSKELSNRFAAGENVELHDVMVASQEADIAMRLAVTMRNQVLEAYREIIRMPV
ncbi:flagellar hook-basal body complex protein FliE [bacterium (Candidatus Blackallbacteria) CG17_big_fil_post_rev_8_21_14_2_50_48_46]|uniref:Flagellar hook-basal body complex protein FliE n=1 Tax=bacterium (Candidatus Blackallbacteria) CG17_big_fil_post_rev_8_21_14_2_50_48_46 TaxID=2014261 RepID=A0A2M7G9B6_9BACT|nr:MAG: flagellar hook-basal body complex protein FliE [bacterium (Candidatus Blackallbacteria) CG18_big_fil_WC_8_21_14_2_50_49_26]PIW18699.1 MAG: flagellar hook-basal body complex protein FliE [bacterium (Candidatus Blackallbacteria) CG17_big_fil_post_rev_8_21_14_2_50_48_46]PIW46315.1 MAG: flagellar hook-basal body complex protein FliE [bacterium (Candidatus Blackallbacteria) CG13_big_fil_rev_8_21_14_2_50_49_14]